MLTETINLPADKKIYFVSDLHLGSPDHDRSLVREKKMVDWLNTIASDAASIYFLGDIFDFWFEYKHVVPKGFIRFLGKISELKDSGIDIFFFVGNHDMWMFNYFPKELNIPVYRNLMTLQINDRKLLIGHGDGLGPGDSGYKFIKRVFSNPFCQWLFARIHPNLGFRIANYWSMKSRESGQGDEIPVEKDRLIKFCIDEEKQNHHDFYVFGHRHSPFRHELNLNSVYYNLGDWIDHFTYGEFSGSEFQLKSSKED